MLDTKNMKNIMKISLQHLTDYLILPSLINNKINKIVSSYSVFYDFFPFNSLVSKLYRTRDNIFYFKYS